jgi:hypothetical protein
VSIEAVLAMTAPWLGKKPKLRLSLAKRGLFWLTLSIVLDYSTSWLMMSSLGASAEGTALVRDFYETRTVGAFLALLDSQVVWIVLVVAAAAAFLVYRGKVEPKDKMLFLLYQYLGLAVALAWLMGAGRLMLGPTSNVSALIQSVYGPDAGSWSDSVLLVAVGTIILFDFVWTYHKSIHRLIANSNYGGPCYLRSD